MPPLLIFLQLVADRAVTHRAVLMRWIDDHAAMWGIDSRELARHRPDVTEKVLKPVDCHLILQLESYGANPEHYLLSAWFQRGGRSKVLRRDEEPIAVEAVPEVLDRLVTRDPEVTRDAASRLVVELVLPRKLINQDIDQWPVAPAGFSRPLGAQHPVVVRPFERLHTPALHFQWRRKWEWLKEHGHDPRATAGAMRWIRQPREVNPQQLMIQMMAADTPVCIFLGFAPPAANDLGSDEFAAGVHSGAPVIVWCRDGRPAEGFEAELQRMLDDQGLLHLPEVVHRHRQEAYYPDAPADHLGRHLTLLWDDFDRRPEDFEKWTAPVRGAG